MQQNLVNDLKNKGSTVAGTRLESVIKLPGWFKTNRVNVLAYLDLNKLSVGSIPS